jgi:hypothetical protein
MPLAAVPNSTPTAALAACRFDCSVSWSAPTQSSGLKSLVSGCFDCSNERITGARAASIFRRRVPTHRQTVQAQRVMCKALDTLTLNCEGPRKNLWHS